MLLSMTTYHMDEVWLKLEIQMAARRLFEHENNAHFLHVSGPLEQKKIWYVEV